MNHVDNTLYINTRYDRGILAECIMLIESTKKSELGELLKKNFLKAGIERINLDQRTVTIGEHANNGLFSLYRNFDFLGLYKKMNKLSKSISFEDILICTFIKSTICNHVDDDYERIDEIIDYYLKEKDYINLLIAEHNRFVLDFQSDARFKKLIKAIPTDIRPTIHTFEEYCNGFTDLMLELSNLKAEYEQRLNPHAPKVTNEFLMKNHKFKVFRTKLYNIINYLYDNCIISYRNSGYNHFIIDMSKIIYNYMDLAFHFISPLSNMRTGKKSGFGGGNYERTELTDYDLFMSCYYLDDDDLNFLMNKHAISELQLSEQHKRYLISSFNNLISSYSIIENQGLSKYMKSIHNFILFFRRLQLFSEELKDISIVIINILDELIDIEAEYDYIMCRNGINNILEFLFFLKDEEENVFPTNMLVKVIERILGNLINNTREKNVILLEIIHENHLILNLVNLLGKHDHVDISDFENMPTDSSNLFDNEKLDIYIQVHPNINERMKEKLGKVIQENITRMTASQLFRVIINRSLPYNSLIEDRFLELSRKYSNSRIIEKYSHDNPLYCIARLHEQKMILDISVYKGVMGQFSFFDFVCLPKDFDYRKFKVSWSSWLQLEEYRDIAFENNYEILKEKYKDAMKNGASEIVKVIYYKYFY